MSDRRSAALRLRKLELEEKRAEREREERQAEREERKAARKAKEKKAAEEAKAQRLVLEAEERREQREEKRRKLEATVSQDQTEQDARLKAEQIRLNHEISLVKPKVRQAEPGNGKGVDGQIQSNLSGAGNLALQTKRFGKIIRHVLPKMPLESAELLNFLRP